MGDRAALDDADGTVEGSFTEAPTDPELPPGDAAEEPADTAADDEIPQQPELGQEPPQEKDETPLTPEQVVTVKGYFSPEVDGKVVFDASLFSQFANADRNWQIRKLPTMKKWQLDEIVAAFAK